MKILQVSSFMPPHPGGLELVVHNLVEGLRERGHDVRWIASAAPLPPGTDGHLIRVAAFKRLEELLHVPLPFWGAAGLRALRVQCAWADVVHVHDCLYPSSLAALLIAKQLRKPVVVTQHIAMVPYASPLELVLAGAYRTLGRFVLEQATRVVAYSAHVPAYFRAIGVKQAIQLIPLGFDARFSPALRRQHQALRRKYGVPNGGPVVLFVGRLVPKKGVADVAAVQARLAERGYTLLAAGDGALAGLVDSTPNTVRLKHVHYAEMHELYALADVLFLPSRGEGLPLTLQEALLSGLPAVVSEDPSYTANVAGAPGVTLCEGIEAWSAAVVAAVERPEAPEAISAWANEHFGKALFLGGYEGVYRDVLAAGAHRSA
jgi:glycosyltransferase involved in cell wall biosynthesis